MIIYDRIEELNKLVAERMVSRRKHPSLDIFIYNYTAAAQSVKPMEWPEALMDARGLILDSAGAIVARPFRKFWNYEQVLDRIPSEPFTVWEKLDGSLGIVCWHEGNLVVATRGSFESDQSAWARNHLKDVSLFQPGLTYLTEIIFPDNRIVVDYGDRRDMPLLAVTLPDGSEDMQAFERWPASKARCFDGIDITAIDAEPSFQGQEGFVVRWQSGYRAKVKLAEYKRLHRLITQCSTRTIWELLRAGKDTAELIDRVPAEFYMWVREQISSMEEHHDHILGWADTAFKSAPVGGSRKDFAEYAKKQMHPSFLFALLDSKPISDMAWKLIEPSLGNNLLHSPESGMILGGVTGWLLLLCVALLYIVLVWPTERNRALIKQFQTEAGFVYLPSGIGIYEFAFNRDGIPDVASCCDSLKLLSRSLGFRNGGRQIVLRWSQWATPISINSRSPGSPEWSIADFNVVENSHVVCGRLSEISVVKRPQDLPECGVGGKRNLRASNVVCKPDIGPLILLKVLASVCKGAIGDSVCFLGGEPQRYGYARIDHKHPNANDLDKWLVFSQPWEALVLGFLGWVAAGYGWIRMSSGTISPRTGLGFIICGFIVLLLSTLAFFALEGNRLMDEPLDVVQSTNDLSSKVLSVIIHRNAQELVFGGAVLL